MVASWSTKGDDFFIDQPRRWSDKQIPGLGAFPIYDVAPDGASILVMTDNPDTKPETHLRVLLNVNEELERRAAKRSGAK